jgi:hypothetical protein
MDPGTERQDIRLFVRQQAVMAPTDLSTPDDLALYLLPGEIVPRDRWPMVRNLRGWVMARVVSFVAKYR